MKVIAAALVAATFVLTNVVLAHAAPISTSRSNKKAGMTANPVKTDGKPKTAISTSRSNIKRPAKAVAAGDVNRDGVAANRGGRAPIISTTRSNIKRPSKN
jgi:hypothetical protein